MTLTKKLSAAVTHNSCHLLKAQCEIKDNGESVMTDARLTFNKDMHACQQSAMKKTLCKIQRQCKMCIIVYFYWA